MTPRKPRKRNGVAGFTMIEMLMVTALMGAILAALATVTAQWLPNWNRGMASVQRADALGGGLERIIADLSAAEFIPLGRGITQPLFEGGPLAVVFVRTALGPNARPGLEIVRIAEIGTDRGPAVVRTRSPYVPVSVEDFPSYRPNFADPVVLLRSPYRVTFSYAGADRVWHDAWPPSTELPKAIRVRLRDGATDRTLTVSTAVTVHADMPVDCIAAEIVTDCLGRLRTPGVETVQ
jgi:general secretion pathway protein J